VKKRKAKKSNAQKPQLTEEQKSESWRRFVWLEDDIEIIPPPAKKPKKP